MNESSKDVIFSVQNLIDEGYSEKDAIFRFKYIINAFERKGLIKRNKIPDPINKDSVLTNGCYRNTFNNPYARRIIKRTINSVISARTVQDIDYIVHTAVTGATI